MTNSIYENNLTGALCQLNEQGYNGSLINGSEQITSKLADLCYTLYSNVTLRSSKNIKLINMSDIPFDSFVDEAVIAFLRPNKLDAILSCVTRTHMLALITLIANNKVIDMVRAWSRSNPIVKDNNTTVNQYASCDGSQRLICHLEDEGWSLLSNETDIENDYLAYESRMERHNDVKLILSNIYKLSAFQAASFLYTKVLTTSSGKPLKPSIMAVYISECGFERVAKAIFFMASKEFGVEYDEYFSDFSEYTIPCYGHTERELSDKISKEAYVGKMKILSTVNKEKKIDRKEEKKRETKAKILSLRR